MEPWDILPISVFFHHQCSHSDSMAKKSFTGIGALAFDDMMGKIGPWSIVALATVAGVLIEVPVMLIVVYIVNNS